MSVTTGAITRVSNNLTLEQDRAYEKRLAEFDFDRLQEIDQMMQVSISGLAAGLPSYSTIQLEFGVEFYDADAGSQRWSDLTRPQFQWGVYISSIEDNEDGILAPFFTATPVRWKERTGSIIIGCDLVVGVAVPGYEGDGVKFSGDLHCTFSGYGAIAENSVDVDVGS